MLGLTTIVQEINNETGAGSINPGAYSVAVINTGAADIIMAGVRVPAGASFNMPFIGTTYDQIDYNATGSSCNIAVFRKS